ncbi:hypothetical protein EHQ43_04310 [Leptospira bouyouniensis]|uniref:Uncharacterized protein n=1 Tax=Leptospira bouyouniensis TaxID=2484911 RepID=A0A7I0HVK5_9LEPT|nr:hypothetical protein [Leptospira bouyouniensis]TGL08275.1 hypothetical protein EHQ43_04310 [Leptospira bouyouniensis]
MNWHVSLFSAVILILFSLANLFADKIPLDQSLLSLKDEIREWKHGKISSHFQQKIRKKSIYPIEDGNCKLELASKISSVTYYRLSCQESEEPSLIEFLSQKSKQIAKDKFRLRAVHRIGKKQYLEIQTGLSEAKTTESKEFKKNLDDTELDYPIKKEKSIGDERYQHQSKYKPIQNPNLFYFQSIAENPKRRKEVPSNLEVFFDTSCPLEYLEKDQSFYWDQTVSYVFRITCVKDSVYRLIRVPSVTSGELMVSNTIWRDPKPGERVLGKALLKKISETQIIWEKVILYYE